MRVDVHAHCFPAEYLNLLDRFGGSVPGADFARGINAGIEGADMDARFRMMDRAGVDRQLLSISPQSPYFREQNHAVTAACLANDIFAGLVQEYPDRFLAVGCLPLPHPNASIAEAARCLEELGMLGFSVGITVLGRSITDPAFDPLLSELDRRAALLFLHPSGDACGSSLIAEAGLTWPLGAPIEDGVAVIQLMKAGIATRYPRLRVVVPHLGGFLPFLMRRLDHQAPWVFGEAATNPSVMARAFWYDTVNGHPPSLRCAVETLGADRLLFGSDFPYWRDEAYSLSMRYIEESGLDLADVARIQEENTSRLLGLDPESAADSLPSR